MKKTIITTVIFICFVMPGCVTSLQPLATNENVITDNRISGTWKNDKREINVQPLSQHSFYKKNKKEFDELVKKTKKVGNASGDSVLFSKSYIIDYTKENIHYYLVGCLVQLNNHLFMNFTPIESSDIKDNENEKTSYDPGNSFGGYTIAKVLIINSNTIQLDFIDGGYIYDQVKSGHMKIKNERNELYDTFLITASTGELNQFLKKYGNDPRLYNKENKVTLIRKT